MPSQSKALKQHQKTFAFKGGQAFTARSYLAAVDKTAKRALAIAAEDDTDPEGQDFVDIVNAFYLSGEPSVRQVLAFSPNLYEIRMEDIDDTLAMAQMEAKKRQEYFMGNTAYRAFEIDLWDAIRKQAKKRRRS